MKKKDNNRQSQTYQIWLRFKKNKPAYAGLIIFTAIVVLAIAAQIFIPQERSIVQNSANRLMRPCGEYLFGTDSFGRDQFARVAHSAILSLTLGVGCSMMSLIMGTVIGGCSALYKKMDNILMRAIDVLASIPQTLLAIILVAIFGTQIMNLMLAISISGIPLFARLARSTMLGIIDQDYVVAARTYGTNDVRLLWRHILPNAIGPLIVQTTMSVADMMLQASSLSYIGLGVQPPTPEWGSMLNSGREYLQTHVYLLVYPGLAIVITALSVNLLGDGLRDALDPRLKS